MSANTDTQLQDLQRAIMARAEELAQEFDDKAKRQRDNILRDAAERLHLAEEREVPPVFQVEQPPHCFRPWEWMSARALAGGRGSIPVPEGLRVSSDDAIVHTGASQHMLCQIVSV